MNEIKFHGRGGQGVVMASQMLGLAFFKADMYPQCYSVFGGERRGAPVVSFLRVDNERILLKCDIQRPNELLYFDSTLINELEIKEIMAPGSKILINTNADPGQFEALSNYTLGLIDATGIAESVGLNHVINTTVIGAYCRFTGHVSLEHLKKAVGEMVPAKVDANKEAVQKGYDGLAVIEGGR